MFVLPLTLVADSNFEGSGSQRHLYCDMPTGRLRISMASSVRCGLTDRYQEILSDRGRDALLGNPRPKGRSDVAKLLRVGWERLDILVSLQS